MNSHLRLHLAPMEGVVDWVFRDLLTNVGGIDQCVTEFIRVTDKLHSEDIFYKYAPELKTNSKTLTGIPVFVQLLGGQPGPLAENAAMAAELGACGVDLNFGCPAKTVNRHDGGAVLLRSPDRIFNIVQKVRAAVPAAIPVTAKIRLGCEDSSLCLENACAIEGAGASALTVHCRTKLDMYKPPAYWEWIPKIKAKVKLKVIANGDIWTAADFQRCQEVTGCMDFMIGRGAVANPYLFLQVKGLKSEISWSDVKKLLLPFYEASRKFRTEMYAVTRSKQWLCQLAKHYKEADYIFKKLKVIQEPHEFALQLRKTSLVNAPINSECLILDRLADDTIQNYL